MFRIVKIDIFLEDKTFSLVENLIEFGIACFAYQGLLEAIVTPYFICSQIEQLLSKMIR